MGPKAEGLSCLCGNKQRVVDRLRYYIIMCGGYYEQFDKPKALTEVHGEPVIKRTLRLLERAGIRRQQIYITVSDHLHMGEFTTLGVAVLLHENTYRYEGGQMHGYWLDAFYTGLPQDAKVTYLYGDVVYTQEAINTITSCDRHGNILFGTRILP